MPDMLEEQIARLSPAKRALLEQRLRAKSPLPIKSEITRRLDRVSAPLSSSQQRFWFLHQWEHDSPLYNSPMLLRLEGELDIPTLQQALDALVTRHEALRTAFRWQDGEPSQIILDPAPVLLKPIGPDILSEIWAREEASYSFDLEAGVLLRAAYQSVNAHEHLLLLTVAHIAFDGWSRAILLRDLSVFYTAFVQNSEPNLPSLPIQYGDYAFWQQEQLSSPTMHTHLDYWKEQLADMPAALSLPTDRPRPPMQTYRGDRLPFTISASLVESLRSLGHREGVTLFMTLIAAFQTLLARSTGQYDCVVGSPIAGRTQSETEELIGGFVNTLVLRTDLTSDPTFRDVLARVRETCLHAFAHQDIPFETLVEELHPERDQSRSPLVQVMLVLQNAPKSEISFSGLECRTEDVDTQTAKFDLLLNLESNHDVITGRFEYNTDLFDAETIARFCEHFQTLLTNIVADPDKKLSELQLLSNAERHQLLVEWNQTARDFPTDQTLASLFVSQAARTPDAVAVMDETQSITYRDLDTASNRLARYLQSLEVGPEVCVGVCLERTVPIVTALLGILKAGGAYVPLDERYPEERNAFVLSDAQTPLLITQSSLTALLPETKAQHVLLDLDQEAIAAFSSEPITLQARPDTLAYVMYTSGSTGQPKGVAIEHRSAATLVHWAQELLDASALSCVLASTSLCFDLSVFELFATLSWGGTVLMAENALHLPTHPERNRVTLINTVPSAIAELVRSGGIPSSVRVINLAGEFLPQALVDQLYALGHVDQVFDLYGPTEDTVYSTVALRQPGGHPTIGRPISNTQAYVLDTERQPALIGISGELYMAGAGLARGYLNRPDLTSEKFVFNPFSEIPNARMYRTGDLVRWLPDGQIEYLGRLDHQVKIRGFRIELGEIESALAAHPALRECVVIARQEASGDQRLVAYFVPNPNCDPSASDLSVFLKTRLPYYMIPNAFVCLDSMPLTPNGKRDLKRLPAFGAGQPEITSHVREGAAAETSTVGADYVPPSDLLQATLQQIWQETLGVYPIGIRENFFDLGGHSLLALRMRERIVEAIGCQFPITALFAGPTIEQLALAIVAFSASDAKPQIIPIQPNGLKSPFFFLNGDFHGGGLYCRNLAKYLGEDQPFYALPPYGLDGEALPASLQLIAQHHVAVLRAFQPEGPYHLGGFCNGGLIAYEMACLLQKERQEVKSLVLIHASMRNSYFRLLHHVTHGFGRLCGRSEWTQVHWFLKVRSVVTGRFQRQRTETQEPGEEDLSNPQEQYEKLYNRYRMLMADYIPSRYSGPVHVLWPFEAPAKRMDDPIKTWLRVAGSSHVTMVPGTHLSCITEHAKEMAELICRCLNT